MNEECKFAGYIGLAALFIGFPFALKYPRHHLYIAIILHPWPGKPGYQEAHSRSVTWVTLQHVLQCS